MRASAVVVLFTVLGCLPYATGQAKKDLCANLKTDHEVQECHAKDQKETNGQADALAVQEATRLSKAIQNGNVGTAVNDPTPTATALRYDVHMSDCENHWVALYHEPKDSGYMYGFVYIDPQAGFTLQHGGAFTVDGQGNYHEATDVLRRDKINLKIRLEQNGVAALLPPRAIAQLGLAEKPDWLKFYEDKADPVTHKVSWGFFYNAIGDSRRAIDYLEPAYSERPDAPRVVFELTYAYNAVARPEDALRVSKKEFAKNPKDELLCREIAFADLNIKGYKEATEQYPICIALCEDSDTARAEKSELAMNLASAYEHMADTQNRDAWMKKAEDWAPKGSPVYKLFHPDEQ